MNLSENLNKLSLISVIIPVYNVEKYLKDCLNSIIVQTFYNIEIILIDDGSIDDTGKICDEYASKDERIRVFHKENGGVAQSRNIGVEKAKGDYILFVDGDDIVDEKIVEALYDVLLENDADISICGLTDYKNKAFEKVQTERKTIVMNSEEAIETMLYQKYYDTGPVAKLIKSNIVKNNRFPDGKIFEDLYTVYKFLNDADKIVYISDVYYYYRQNEISTMHKDFDIDIFDELSAIDEIEGFISREHPEIMSAFYARKFSSYCQVLGWMPVNQDDRTITGNKEKIWKFITQYRKEMIGDRKARRKNRYAALLSYCGQYIFGILLKMKKNISN